LGKNAVKKNSLFFVGVLLLAGCQWRSSSIPSSSINSSSIPIPTDDFSPYLRGRKFLIQQTKTSTYSTVVLSDLTEVPLSKINYPTNEDSITPYAVKDAALGQFSNQTITFDLTVQPDVRDALASMTIGVVGSESETVALLNDLTISDGSFNQRTTVKKEKNLSHAFLESDYYWFNHYLLEETMTVQRYQNQILYGTANQIKVFQTEVSVPVGVQYQLYADSSMIYEIRDETYPSNFFGARDVKFETIRTQDNFKKALTLGPANEMIGYWQLLKQGLIPFDVALQEPLVNYQSSIEMVRTTTNTIVFSLRIYRGESWLDSVEGFEMTASLNGQTWRDVEQTYLLWEPSVTG
jgi:hypothetical protein